MNEPVRTCMNCKWNDRACTEEPCTTCVASFGNGWTPCCTFCDGSGWRREDILCDHCQGEGIEP